MSELTIAPCRDGEIFNKLLNDPEILPHIRDDSLKGAANIIPLLNRMNVALLISDGETPVGFGLFIQCGPGIYELHSGILKEYRGAKARDAAMEILDWMFINTECETITTWAWSTAKHVLLLANLLGFVEDAQIPWPNPVNGQKVDRFVYSMHILEWSRNARRRHQRDGWSIGVPLESYQFGLFSLFAKIGTAGFFNKAVMLYQRWAPVLRMPMVQVLSSLGGNFTIVIDGQVMQIDRELNTTVIEPKPKPPEQMPRIAT